MARPVEDDDERPRKKARRPINDDDDEDERPRKKARRSDDDDDYEHPDDRKRKKGDATGGVIPYKNGMALASYYCGVFSLIPCIGGLLGPIALILGVMGLMHAKKNPESRGQAHAIVGIVLGLLVLLGHLAAVVYVFVFSATR